MDQCVPVPPVLSMSWLLAPAPSSWLLPWLLPWLLAPLLAAGALANYPYYTDYTDYNSVYARASVANISTAKISKRTIDFSGKEPYKFTILSSLVIPLPDLDSSLTIRLPYTWEFGGETAEDTARREGHFHGRSGTTHGTTMKNKRTRPRQSVPNSLS